MALEKGDFIEIKYTGKIQTTGAVFDTTDEKIAKDNNLNTKNMRYGPITICLGQGHLMQGLDNRLIGKQENNSYDFQIPMDEAFGKRDPKLVKMMPITEFQKQKINPFPGLELNFEGQICIVRSVNSGRVMVDFNHPLSGRNLIYDIEVLKKITDTDKKINSLINMYLGYDKKYDFKEEKLTINEKVPEQMQKFIEENFKKLIKEVKNIEFSKPKE